MSRIFMNLQFHPNMGRLFKKYFYLNKIQFKMYMGMCNETKCLSRWKKKTNQRNSRKTNSEIAILCIVFCLFLFNIWIKERTIAGWRIRQLKLSLANFISLRPQPFRLFSHAGKAYERHFKTWTNITWIIFFVSYLNIVVLVLLLNKPPEKKTRDVWSVKTCPWHKFLTRKI